jgi:hypothetical protein
LSVYLRIELILWNGSSEEVTQVVHLKFLHSQLKRSKDSAYQAVFGLLKVTRPHELLIIYSLLIGGRSEPCSDVAYLLLIEILVEVDQSLHELILNQYLAESLDSITQLCC